MIAKKKEFSAGLLLMGAFWVVFAIIMSPVFEGKNILDYMDNLYNSISKASSYYIPDLQKKAETYRGSEAAFQVKAKTPDEANRMKALLEAGGAGVNAADTTLDVKGDLGAIVQAMLADADTLFANEGDTLTAKYGVEPRQAIHDWYSINKTMVKEFEKKENFKMAKILYDSQAKGIEPAYNYYGIEATKITDKIGTVIFSLLGYVIYTLWFGFAILFLFEGWGLKLEH